MSEQDTWFEVQVRRAGLWLTIGDYDTREDAESVQRGLRSESRVRRVHGQEV